MKNLILGFLAFFGVALTRVSTRDVAIQFRMNAGFPGDVNRTHPASIEGCKMDPDDPPSAYGVPVLVDAATQGVRGILAADTTVTTVWGVTVRPYPIQQATATDYGAVGFGEGAPPLGQPVDVLRLGYIMVKIPAGQAAVKGGPVFVWIGADGGGHFEGRFEGIDGGADTIDLDPKDYQFNGSPDALGNIELCINL